jgi:hypothetical protein
LVSIDGAVKLGGAVAVHALNVMARRHAIGAEVVGDAEQVAEFDGLVAAHAGDRRFAADVTVGEIVDHALA